MTIAANQRVPNTTLRQVRTTLGMSQSELAEALRKAGEAAGEPNSATKRLVQKWESGEHAWCRPKYGRALQAVTGFSHRQLGLTMHSDEYTPQRQTTDPPAPGETTGEAINRIQHELRRATGRQRNSLAHIGGHMVAGGQAAALGGWLALDNGDTAGAERYFTAALAATRALSTTTQSD